MIRSLTAAAAVALLAGGAIAQTPPAPPPPAALPGAAAPAPAQPDLGAVLQQLQALQKQVEALQKAGAPAPTAAPAPNQIPAVLGGPVAVPPSAGGASTAAPSAPAAAPTVEYVGGWVVAVSPIPDKADLGRPVQDYVGKFIADPAGFNLASHRKAVAVKLTGALGYAAEGFLNVKAAGRYTLATQVNWRDFDRTMRAYSCALSGSIEDQKVIAWENTNLATGRAGTETVIGGADLEKGLYRVKLWLGCSYPVGDGVSIELLARPAGADGLAPLTAGDLVHPKPKDDKPAKSKT